MRKLHTACCYKKIVTSIQDSKPRQKQFSQSFSYYELINMLRNGTISVVYEKKEKGQGIQFFTRIGLLN